VLGQNKKWRKIGSYHSGDRGAWRIWQLSPYLGKTARDLRFGRKSHYHTTHCLISYLCRTSSSGSFTPQTSSLAWARVSYMSRQMADGRGQMVFTVACGERAVSAPKEAFVRALAGEFGGVGRVSFWRPGMYPEKLPMSSLALLSQREEKRREDDEGRWEMGWARGKLPYWVVCLPRISGYISMSTLTVLSYEYCVWPDL
jgi:hypothetical protein